MKWSSPDPLEMHLELITTLECHIGIQRRLQLTMKVSCPQVCLLFLPPKDCTFLRDKHLINYIKTFVKV